MDSIGALKQSSFRSDYELVLDFWTILKFPKGVSQTFLARSALVLEYDRLEDRRPHQELLLKLLELSMLDLALKTIRIH